MSERCVLLREPQASFLRDLQNPVTDAPGFVTTLTNGCIYPEYEFVADIHHDVTTQERNALSLAFFRFSHTPFSTGFIRQRTNPFPELLHSCQLLATEFWLRENYGKDAWAFSAFGSGKICTILFQQKPLNHELKLLPNII